MDNKKKAEWIIKYIKKNNLEYLLNSKFREKNVNWINGHSNEIQSICSLVSVFVIGIFSLLLTFKYNNLVKMQTEIMKYEQKPNINILLEKDIEEGIDCLTIINNGMATQSYSVEVIPFFNVICNENQFGNYPIRIYLIQGINDFVYTNSQIGEMAYIKVYNNLYNSVYTIKNDLYEIINDYTELFWSFDLNYLISVKSIDRMDEIDEDYFIYNQYGIKKILDEEGSNINNDYWSLTLAEGIHIFPNLNADILFEYTLKLLREKNLYTTKDLLTNEYVLYGDYEP